MAAVDAMQLTRQRRRRARSWAWRAVIVLGFLAAVCAAVPLTPVVVPNARSSDDVTFVIDANTKLHDVFQVRHHTNVLMHSQW